MKISSSLLTLGAALVVAGAANFAFANGTHEGGHEHGGHEHADGEHQAIGQPGVASAVKRTIAVTMSDDMRFTPSNFSVKRGETVRFVIKNVGQVKHEFVLGTEAELKEHYEMMKKFPTMEHSDPSMVTVAPGKTEEIVWNFSRAGRVEIGCLQPGHFDAGMRGAVSVLGGKK